jgi:hypothetical protein
LWGARKYSGPLRIPHVKTLSSRRRLRRELLQTEWPQRLEQGKYSQRYTAQYAWAWWGAFKSERLHIRNYLELGSWEGQSLALAGWLFPEAKLTAVDWFTNPQAVSNYNHNTSSFKERLTSIKGTSWEVLAKWAAEGHEKFDVIYIDSDHRFDGVLLDSALAWQLLKVGGYVVWDDYLWEEPQVKPLYAKPALDAFLRTRKPFYDIVFADWQICARKTSPDPAIEDMALTFEVV